MKLNIPKYIHILFLLGATSSNSYATCNQSPRDFINPGLSAACAKASRIIDSDDWSIKASIAFTCPLFRSILDIQFYETTSSLSEKPEIKSVPVPTNVSHHIFPIDHSVDGSTVCRSEKELTPGYNVVARCQDSASKITKWARPFRIGFVADCTDGSLDGLHEPTVRVDTGPPPDIRTKQPTINVFTSSNLSSSRSLDVEPGLGIRLGLGIHRRFSLELGAEWTTFEVEDSPWLGGDMATIDLHTSYSYPLTERLILNAFAGPGWRLASPENITDPSRATIETVVQYAEFQEESRALPGNSFSLSGGLSLEWRFTRRWSMELRVAERWLEDSAYDSWTTEGHFGICYSFDRPRRDDAPF